MSYSPEMIGDLDPMDQEVLNASLKAPSAHNTQPWLIRPLGEHSYDLYHREGDDLPEPRELLSYLNAGTFVETLALQASNHGRTAEITPVLEREDRGLLIGRVVIGNLLPGQLRDPLSQYVDQRVTNRNRYSDEPLDIALVLSLRKLGNVLLTPNDLNTLVKEAGMEAWSQADFVKDLAKWFRSDNDAEDGITPGPFNLPKGAGILLNHAAKRGGLKSRIMRSALVSQDVKSFNAAPSVAVLDAEDNTPHALFDAGRRLLRSWATITGRGYSYHPFSGPVFFDDFRTKVAELTGQRFPVALYRVGRATKPQQISSNRKPLEKFLVD